MRLAALSPATPVAAAIAQRSIVRVTDMRCHLRDIRDRADRLRLPLSLVLLSGRQEALSKCAVDAEWCDAIAAHLPTGIEYSCGPLGRGRWGLVLADVDDDLARRVAVHVAALFEQHGKHVNWDVQTYDPNRPGVAASRDDAVGYPLGEFLFRESPAWKRRGDVIVSCIGLVFFAPFCLAIAAYIKAVSRGPVWFAQQRVGARGRPFRILKFRTMRVTTDTADHQQYVRALARNQDSQLRKFDYRQALLPGARWLRTTGIDELPQLLNVLRGEMSLVGPRPDVLSIDAYQQDQLRRFDVLPGMTGLWQVSGKNTTTFAEMIQLDMAYVEKRSIWLDIKILLLTPYAVLKQCLVRGERKSQPDKA